MTTRIRIDDGDGTYTVARHMLDEIETAGPRGISAADLGEIVGDLSGAQAGAWLRELRARGWVESDPDRPEPGDRTRWFTTAAGREEIAKGADGSDR